MFSRVAVKDSVEATASADGGMVFKAGGEHRTAGGINRVEQWLNSEKGFMQITNFRKSTPIGTNISQFRTVPTFLRAVISDVKTGGYWMIGHWTECSTAIDRQPGETADQACTRAGGTMQTALEYSWFFIQPQNCDNDLWMAAGVKLAKQYEQDAFILRQNGESVAGLYGKGGEKWTDLSTADAIFSGFQQLAVMRETMESFGYSELHSLKAHGDIKPIVFTTASKRVEAAKVQFHCATTDNIASQQMFAALGILKP